MSSYKYSRKDLSTALFLFLISLIAFILVALWRGVPGYMDESYYLIGSRNLTTGNGFQEDILWNFLDEPEGIPHPSHLYWMPFVSLVSAVGMKVFGVSYLAACLPHALIAALISPIIFLFLLYRLEERFWAIVGASVSLFGGYYLLYYSAVDAFSVYMVLGFGYFHFISRVYRDNQNRSQLITSGLLSGAIAGLMHLTRADGLIWAMMIPVFIIGAAVLKHKNSGIKPSYYLLSSLISISVYLLVMSPWYLRNLQLFGSLTPLGSTSNLFLTTYNDLFAYPATIITSQRWLSDGFLPIFQQRLQAAGVNLLSWAGVQMAIIQIPFFLVGVWKNRDSIWVRVNIFGMLILFGFFTLIFPLAGMRGSYFHSGTIFQIFTWVMTIYGLRFLITKLPVNEGIAPAIFSRFIGIGFLTIFAVITGFILASKIASWRNGVEEIEVINQVIGTLDIGSNEVILINDPATFNWISQRPAIVIPSGNEATMAAVMERYDVNLAVLQFNHPPELDGLYLAPTESEYFDVVAVGDDWYLLVEGD